MNAENDVGARHRGAALPIIWDADFLFGPPDAAGDDTHVLCEINVSSVFAIPDEVSAEIARAMVTRLRIRTAPRE